MKFIKTVSFLSIMTVAMSSVSYGAPMTAQIRRLLEEKEEKIKQLEQCDGKRKGWMIAGVSTIGLTAVGVGVNIAQANKSSKLSDQIDTAKQELSRHETHLSQIQSQISEKEREKAEAEKAAREEAEKRRAAEEGYGNQGGEDDITDGNDVVSSVITSNSKQYNLDPRIYGIDYCYYNIDGTYQSQSGCSVSNSGDWGVKFPEYIVMGIAACSDLPGEYNELATDQAKVDAAYTRTSTSLPKGGNCYCKMESPVMSSWVFKNTDDDSSYCAYNCAFHCALSVRYTEVFRGGVFGAAK